MDIDLLALKVMNAKIKTFFLIIIQQSLLILSNVIFKGIKNHKNMMDFQNVTKINKLSIFYYFTLVHLF